MKVTNGIKKRITDIFGGYQKQIQSQDLKIKELEQSLKDVKKENAAAHQLLREIDQQIGNAEKFLEMIDEKKN